MKQKRKKVMANICIILGIACLFYFLLVAVVGYGTYFFVLWGIMGVILTTAGVGIGKGWTDAIPVWIKAGIGGAVIIGAILFLFVEGCIVSGFTGKEQQQLDYLLVLGAQLKQNGPSRTLQMRLDAAYDYAVKNTDTIVIVSGGKGPDEPDTEAQGMYDYLLAKGLDSDRILREDQSVNTHENIVKSSVYLDKTKDTVGIVTSDFHVFRAMKLAEAAGYKQVYGIPAASEKYMLPNNMLREGMAVIKDYLVGNLR